jgi:hypothetical protein
MKMKPNILCLIIAANIMAVGASAGRQLESTRVQNDKVVIRPRTIVLRQGAKGSDYKEAIIKIPTVTGVSDPDVLQKIRSNLDLKNVFGYSLAKIRADFKETSWLDEISYEVNYNAGFILDISFLMAGSAASIETSDENRIINLKTGELLKAADVFKTSSLETLATLVEGAMRADLGKGIKDFGDNEIIVGRLREALRESRFNVKNLDNFSVNKRGVTFLYDFGFSHYLDAVGPKGRYFYSFARLKEHIKEDGLLGVFVRKDAN